MLTVEEYVKFVDIHNEVLDVVLGLTDSNFNYKQLKINLKKKYYPQNKERFEEISNWLETRLFNKLYKEKYNNENT